MNLSDWSEADAEAALKAHAGMVQYHATRLIGPLRTCAMDFEDLEAVGRVAVLEGLGSYTGVGPLDARSWVSYRVRARMVDAIRASSALKRVGLALIRRLKAGDEMSSKELQRAHLANAYGCCSIDEPELHLSGDADVESEARRLEHGQRLRAAMAEVLTPRQNDVLELHLTGMSMRAIGERLGVSESRVSQLVKRSRNILTEHFGDRSA